MLNKVDIDMKKCIYCGVCRIVCPQKAIALQDGKMIANQYLCNGCEKCVTKCWRGAIQMQD